MATPKSQRIGIWVIAIVLMIGTLGSFLAMILGTQNQTSDNANIQKEISAYQLAASSQTKSLSDKYYSEFNKYATIPAAFEADGIKTLSKKDLKVGDGAEITSSTSYNAYCIGWNPKGFVFDQSIKDGALIAPLAGGNMITGWNEGVIGMKLGGIRELTIPSDKAYGATGSGDNIPPNTPLKFIVMAIPKVADIPMSAALLEYVQSQQSAS